MRCKLVVAVGAAVCVLGCDNPAPTGGTVPPVEPALTTGVPVGLLTQSSVLEPFDASGVLAAAEPGWHAARQPAYPQWIAMTFAEPQVIHRLSLLPQDTLAIRGPRRVEVQTSEDGAKWTSVAVIPDACQGLENSWRTLALDRPLTTSHLRLLVHANCGDPEFLTLRGVRLH